MAVLIPITLTVQVGSVETLGPLFKNVALFGGLIHFASLPATAAVSAQRMPVLATCLLPLIAGFGFLGGTAMGAWQPQAVAAVQQPLDIVFLVREPNHLKVALSTSAQLLAGHDSLKARAAEVIVCGPKGIEALKPASVLAPALTSAAGQGIQVVACGMSLKELGMSASELLPGIKVVENGLIESIRLQQRGYVSVEL